MMRVYDRVLVGPVRFQDGQTGKHRAGVAMHWRRGHIRRQRFGAGLTETRLAWIEPVLVNANETAPEPKDYKVV